MRFHSKPIEEHEEVPLGDAGQLDELITHWTERRERTVATDGGSACYVLSVHRREESAGAHAQLAEITALVAAQGDRVVGADSHLLVKPDARTYIRSGVAERISARAREHGASMLVLDAELSPSQTRNLEDATGLPICDREAVILNVFERNAKTRRARMQVEIAHLEYLRPRIRGVGLDMAQQTGGMTKARGPGETASELLARRLDDRLAYLRQGLARLEQSDSARRKQRAQCARVVLVGYTNAGKTSLMNALTDAQLSARDRPFETLLVAVDVSDPEAAQHLQTTEAVLERLGAGGVPRLVVFNKLDRVEGPLAREQLAQLSGDHDHVALSSRDPEAVAQLRARVLARVREQHARRAIFVPYARPELSARVYASCRVLQAVATPRGTQFVVEGEPHVVDELARALRRPRP